MPMIHLIECRPLSRRTSQFSFRAPFRHGAGQYVVLQADVGGARMKRYYSIASPPRPDGTIELCIQHDGEFGRYLLGLNAGKAIECGEPSGTMRLLDPHRPAAYFAAGTGVSPVRAILLEHLTANPEADVTLVLGARQVDELLYRDEFDALASRHEGFRFLPVVSGDAPGWRGRRGHVTDHIGAALSGRSDVDAYLCGQPEMVTDMRGRLAAAGIPDDRQSFERY